MTPLPLEICLDATLSDPRVAAFLQEHLDDMHRTSPPECVFALDVEKLRAPGIYFWTAWQGEQLVGTVALKRLDEAHAELKSMRSAARLRGHGIGRRLLAHVFEQARALGFQRLSLETGTHAFFEPAHGLYERYGFTDCGPFAAYAEDPNSRFMTLTLAPR
ncbi:GNAT family N-acetyltransferase [Roseateles koreensis]|uniref:GNAT family N-acetyltransferase n=1 Tax=Roseateles koreensis TaxID=2987526 RepID=A0ABT5KPP7_9BURK|nr:GNAT family N-acetyltransferase [Roseateles koreensis]MDC8784886.1 GNAT family N-acetyltransferase [Roseateles koreensis]